MDPSGSVEARIGASPHGQGLRTTLAQIIADQVGVAPESVRIVHGDTDRTPYGWGTFASRSLVIAGGAITAGGAKDPQKAAHHRQPCVGGCGRRHRAGKRRRQSFGNRSHACRSRHWPAPPIIRPTRSKARSRPGLSESADYDPPGTFSNACHVAIVEVDIETGRVKHRKIPRGGRCRPHHQSADRRRPGAWRHRPRYRQRAVRGDRLRRQRQSADRDARRLHAADRVRDSADRIAPHRIAGGASITGAKGLGEGGAIGAPAAILNAVNDALSPFGVSIDEIPATPQRIRAALRGARRDLNVCS